MRITIRSLNGENAELDVEPDTTILGLRQFVEDALKIPVLEQRLIYAGTQLEELVTPLWRQRRSSGALAAALGLDKLPDGAPLTLEHYGIQKGSVLNVVRKVSLDQTRSAACAESLSRGSLREPGHSPVVGPPVTQLPAAAPCAPCAPCGVGPSPAQLEALNDLELLVLLRPLLRKRPTLRAALLAEAGEPVAAYNPPALGHDGIWQRGERCLVWSNSAQRWCDGEVVQVARELVDGKIPEGSVEVSFELGRKWIAPQDLAKALRR